VVGVALDDLAQPRLVQKRLLILADVQYHRGTALRSMDRGDLVLAVTIGGPVDPVVRAITGAPRVHLDTIGDDERGIEPNTELANELGVLLLVSGHGVKEALRPRARDGAQVFHDLIARHAHAIVTDRDRARVLVDPNTNGQFRVVLKQRLILDGLEAQLIRGVRGVGDEFAQEDLAAGIQRIDHEVQ